LHREPFVFHKTGYQFQRCSAVPLEQATTASLDALKTYTAGINVSRQRGDFAAIPFFQHAIELDPNFALAQAALGGCYENTARDDLGAAYFRKAFALRDRTSEREKFRLSTSYYSEVPGQLEQAAEAGELWALVARPIRERLAAYDRHLAKRAE